MGIIYFDPYYIILFFLFVCISSHGSLVHMYIVIQSSSLDLCENNYTITEKL